MENPKIAPVLFCIYNRLSYTQRSFQQIRKAKPPQLFIAADGPKNKKDKINCQENRAWVVKNVDWKCELKLLFSERNLGCTIAMKDSIDWFFTNVKYGIILEDDCVASNSFFQFCSILLKKYQFNEKIMTIVGFNSFHDKDIWNENNRKIFEKKKTDYIFLKGPFNEFGIATWKRSWVKNDMHLSKWSEYKKKDILKFYNDKNVTDNLKIKLKSICESPLYSCWGNIWITNTILNDGLYIMPLKNMVNNIGEIGVHFQSNGKINKNKHLLNQKSFDIDTSNLKHPKSIEVDDEIFRAVNFALFKKDYKKKIRKNVFFHKTLFILQSLEKSKKFKMYKYGVVAILLWELILILYSKLF